MSRLEAHEQRPVRTARGRLAGPAEPPPDAAARRRRRAALGAVDGRRRAASIAFAFAIMGAIVVGDRRRDLRRELRRPAAGGEHRRDGRAGRRLRRRRAAVRGRAGRVAAGAVRARAHARCGRRSAGWRSRYVAYVALGQLWAQLVDTTRSDKLPDSLGVDESTAALVAVCVLVTVIAPIAEELFFRGYFFGALRNWRGPWPAALLTGRRVRRHPRRLGADAVFLVPLAILGFMLCIVRWRTGSLLPCIALHAINNALAFGVTEDWARRAGRCCWSVGAVGVTCSPARAVLAPGAARPDARPLDLASARLMLRRVALAAARARRAARAAGDGARPPSRSRASRERPAASACRLAGAFAVERQSARGRRPAAADRGPHRALRAGPVA